MRRPIWLKALPLFGFSFVEIAVAFVRMIILTHVLGPYELGFAAAISATYATIEQVTDLAIYRFVSSSPRSAFSEAIAGAHALVILRGLFLSLCILVISYPLACALASCGEWPTFGWLAPVVIIKSFENLEIRVRERDYRYWGQLIASVASHGAGIIAMAIWAYQTGSHYAFIAYLLVQASVYVVASHLLASTTYRAKFNTPYLQKGFSFGLPLMLNGMGLAIIGQGDRLMVGALLGLPSLGLYAVIALAGVVPISGILRVLNPLLFAGLHNARAESEEYGARLHLYGVAVPMIAACYALALIGLFQLVLPIVFGGRFIASDLAVVLIASIAFVRIVRSEPYTSLLLHAQKTQALALSNLSPLIGLASATAFVIVNPRIESVLFGTLIGEFIGLIAIIFVTRQMLRPAAPDYIISMLANVFIVCISGFAAMIVARDHGALGRASIAATFLAIVLIGARVFLPRLYRAAYGTRDIGRDLLNERT